MRLCTSLSMGLPTAPKTSAVARKTAYQQRKKLTLVFKFYIREYFYPGVRPSVQIPCCFHSAFCLLSLQLSLSAIHPRKLGKFQGPGLQKEKQRLTSAPEQHLQRPGDVQAQIPHRVPFCTSAFVTKGVQSCPVTPWLSGSRAGFLLGSQLAQVQAEVGGTTVE